jgi:hypothetical protein
MLPVSAVERARNARTVRTTSAGVSCLRQLLSAAGATIGSRFATGLIRDDARNRHWAMTARARRHDGTANLGLRGGVLHQVSLNGQSPRAGALSGPHRVWIL